jgi:hypothetical protein
VTDKPKTTKIDDEFDIEPRAFEIAQQMAQTADEEQALFVPIRDAMVAAFNAGYAARSIPNRFRHYLRKRSLYRVPRQS